MKVLVSNNALHALKVGICGGGRRRAHTRRVEDVERLVLHCCVCVCVCICVCDCVRLCVRVRVRLVSFTCVPRLVNVHVCARSYEIHLCVEDFEQLVLCCLSPEKIDQSVAVCCSVLQCVAVCGSLEDIERQILHRCPPGKSDKTRGEPIGR